MDPHVSPPAASARTEADVVAAARDLVPQVLAARDECETLRHVPTPMVEALAEAGLLQMYLPRSMGGPELPPLVVFRAIEEISRADGSIGWCTMIATAVSNSMGWLDAEVGRAMAGRPADMRLAGSIRPQGRARPVDGGYRIDGRWDFASGINHARWLHVPLRHLGRRQADAHPGGRPDGADILGAGGKRHDPGYVARARPARHGQPRFHRRRRLRPGEPFVRPPARYPERRACSTIRACHLTWIWTATVANAMGIARGALDAFTELASSKSSTMSTTLLRDRPLVQARVAEAEAILSAARAYRADSRRRSVGRGQARARATSTRPIVQARLAITHGMHEAVRSVDLHLPCRRHQRRLREEPARAALPQHSRRRAACRRPAGSHGGCRQGPPRPASRRCGVVAQLPLPACGYGSPPQLTLPCAASRGRRRRGPASRCR